VWLGIQVFTTSVAVSGDIKVALRVQTTIVTTTTTGDASVTSSSDSSSHEETLACAMSGTLTMTSKDYPGPGLTGEAAQLSRGSEQGPLLYMLQLDVQRAAHMRFHQPCNSYVQLPAIPVPAK
jgi:hypothetical protein